MRHLLDSVMGPHIIKGFDTGTQASMHSENRVLDESSEWDIVEEVREHLPDVRRTIFANTLIVESIHLGYLS